MKIDLNKEEWEFLHRACHHSRTQFNLCDPEKWSMFNVCFEASELAKKFQEKLGTEWIDDE